MRVALFNYVSDPTGASDYTASISISGGQMPAQVSVKYLAASSVAQKYNFTWAGQTFGDVFSSDGRPVGQLDVQTVNCDQSNNVCAINVPAPGFALVFLNGQAQSESDSGATMTFPTTAYTKTENTVTVDQAVLATSNGERGVSGALGGTSKGRGVNSAFGLSQALPSIGAIVAGALIVGRLGSLIR